MATAASSTTSLDVGGEQCGRNPRLLWITPYQMAPQQYTIKLSSMRLDQLDGEGECLVEDDEFTPSIVDRRMEFVLGSSPAPLICLNSEEALYVCNPSTKKFMRLPDSQNHSRRLSTCATAFGYFPSRDEYKVARMIKQQRGTNYHTCEIYTLGRRDGVADPALNCWKTIGDVCRYPVVGGVVANGSCHWLVEVGELGVWTKDLLIISLDVETEMFTTLPPPQDDEVFRFMDKLTLNAVGEHLCLTEHFITQPSIVSIWILKDFNNPIWVKEYSIDILGVDTDHFFHPVYMDDCQLILHDNYDEDEVQRRLVFYDVKSQSIRMIRPIKMEAYYLCVYEDEGEGSDSFLLP